MFFFIAGIQPKTLTLDAHPQMCPSCGLQQAILKRRDHYFSFFFLPIIRVKKGVPVLECRSCDVLTDESREAVHQASKNAANRSCSHCGSSLKSEFRFCPFCGKSV